MTRADQPTDVTEPLEGDLATDSRQRAVNALLRIPRLRKLWTAQLTGSVADRLALLVLTVLAVRAAMENGSFGGGYQGVGLAVAAVLASRFLATFLLGVLLLGPLSTLTAPGGPLDRRWTMITCDALRVVLLIVAPLWIDWAKPHALTWVLVTTFLTGAAERVWTVCKNSAAPALLPGVTTSSVALASAGGLAATMRLRKLDERPMAGDASATVPKTGRSGTRKARKATETVITVRPSPEHIEALHRLDARTGYGAIPLAAAALVVVTLISNVVAVGIGWFHSHQVALASDVAAGLFAASIATLYLLDLPEVAGPRPRSPLEGLRRPKDGVPGEHGKGRTGALPIFVLSVAAACAGMAAAISVAVLRAFDLGGGPVGYGLLVLALSAGPVAGVRLAPRTLPGLSRRRLLALAIAVTGGALLLAGLVPDPTTVLLLAFLAGLCLGIVANTGHTLVDHEAEEARRVRTTEHLHAVVRVFVGLAVVTAPVFAAVIGRRHLDKGAFTFDQGGAAFTFMLAGALLLPVAALLLVRTDDRRGTPLRVDLRNVLRPGRQSSQRPSTTGYFIALEGGDGAGKSTQLEMLAEWIRAKGHEVVVTREPGATAIGKRLRSVLLDVSNTGLSRRAEALLYAADRAEHVDTVVRPALARGAVVISDRYIDSSVAYQGAGRELSATEIARISRWATDGLVPHLTVLLDISPEAARERFTEAPDRLESEPAAFHQRVRGGFLALAAADPSRYLVVDGGQDPEAVATAVRHRLDRDLPLSEQEIRAREEAERRAAEEARKRAEEEARRRAEEERREKEREEQLARLRAEEEVRKQAELEEARRREAERQAEEARRRAEQARRLAAEEAKRRAAEEEARRRQEEATKRLAEEEARLRREAEARRLEKQRRAEEALLRAEEERRRSETESRARAAVQAPTTVSGSVTLGKGAEEADTAGPKAGPTAAETVVARTASGHEDASGGLPEAPTVQTPSMGTPPRASGSIEAPTKETSTPKVSAGGTRPPPRKTPDKSADGGRGAGSPNELTQTVEIQAHQPGDVAETAVMPQLPGDAGASGPAEETRPLPQAGQRSPRTSRTPPVKSSRPSAVSPPDEAGPAHRANTPGRDRGPAGRGSTASPESVSSASGQSGHGDPTAPIDRLPPWMWRREGEQLPSAERTRELPEVSSEEANGPHDSSGAGVAESGRRRDRARSEWAEETPLDDLPTLADELLGPYHDDGDEGRTDGEGDGRRGRRGRG